MKVQATNHPTRPRCALLLAALVLAAGALPASAQPRVVDNRAAVQGLAQSLRNNATGMASLLTLQGFRDQRFRWAIPEAVRMANYAGKLSEAAAQFLDPQGIRDAYADFEQSWARLERAIDQAGGGDTRIRTLRQRIDQTSLQVANLLERQPIVPGPLPGPIERQYIDLRNDGQALAATMDRLDDEVRDESDARRLRGASNNVLEQARRFAKVTERPIQVGTAETSFLQFDRPWQSLDRELRRVDDDDIQERSQEVSRWADRVRSRLEAVLRRPLGGGGANPPVVPQPLPPRPIPDPDAGLRELARELANELDRFARQVSVQQLLALPQSDDPYQRFRTLDEATRRLARASDSNWSGREMRTIYRDIELAWPLLADGIASLRDPNLDASIRRVEALLDRIGPAFDGVRPGPGDNDGPRQLRRLGNLASSLSEQLDQLFARRPNPVAEQSRDFVQAVELLQQRAGRGDPATVRYVGQRVYSSWHDLRDAVRQLGVTGFDAYADEVDRTLARVSSIYQFGPTVRWPIGVRAVPGPARALAVPQEGEEPEPQN